MTQNARLDEAARDFSARCWDYAHPKPEHCGKAMYYDAELDLWICDDCGKMHEE